MNYDNWKLSTPPDEICNGCGNEDYLCEYCRTCETCGNVCDYELIELDQIKECHFCNMKYIKEREEQQAADVARSIILKNNLITFCRKELI